MRDLLEALGVCCFIILTAYLAVITIIENLPQG